MHARRIRHIAAGAATLAASTGGVLLAAPAAHAATLVVGNCQGSSPYSSIQAAVDAASSGDTITVCPGTYHEAVTITKALVLDGAQAGVDASDPSARTAPSAESVIDAPLDASGNAQSPVSYGGGVGGTLDGFTLTGHDGANGQAAPGIAGLYGSGTSAFTWTDDIITGNGEGIQFNTGTAAAHSVISGNRITANDNDSGDGKSGSGIFISNGPADDVTISGNYFRHDGAAENGLVNTTGNGCNPPSTGLVISDNTAVIDDTDDNNFAVLFCTTGAQVTGNHITWTDPSDPNAPSAFYVSGGNTDLTISGNQVTGGAGGAGISINTDFYTPSTGLQVLGNTISGRANGILVRGSSPDNSPYNSGFTINGNSITGSASNGIWVQSGNTSGTLSSNTVSGSGTYDLRDDTTGTGTAGTANTYTSDTATTCLPAGLCSGPASALPEAPIAVGLPAVGLLAGGVLLVRRRRRA